MLPATPIGNKLDLSRLTDEEVKHVWGVIQRDFDLRKKEETRLGELKTKVKKEDNRRELLGAQTSLTASHCIRCLQPFKFLVNSKRQCLDCQLYSCKACSRYNKKERGWVCDSCRMARVLKIGTLEWYHENVRSRFKRFGSAKVMRSLYKRLEDGESDSQTDLRGIDDGHEEDGLDRQKCKLSRKSKRRLPVHPPDFDFDTEYSCHSPVPPFQQGGRGKDLGFIPNRRKSLEKSDERGCLQNRMKRTRSLSKIGNCNGPQHLLCNEMDTSDEESCARASHQPGQHRHSRAVFPDSVGQTTPPITELSRRMSDIESLLNQLENNMSDSPQQPLQQLEPPTLVELEEENLRRKLGELRNVNEKGLSSEDEEVRRPPVLREVRRRNSMAPVCPQPLERLLNTSSDEIPSEEQRRSMAAALCDITAEFLRTINATEKAMAQFTQTKPQVLSSLMTTDGTRPDEAYKNLEENLYLAAGKSYDLETNLQDLEETARSRYCGNTDSELSELEDKVAQAAIKVQNAESEVSDIENKIAALSAGMSGEKSKRKVPIAAQRRRLSLDIPMRTSKMSGIM